MLLNVSVETLPVILAKRPNKFAMKCLGPELGGFGQTSPVPSAPGDFQ